MNRLNFQNLKKLFIVKNEIVIFIFLSFLLYFIFFKNIFSTQFNFWNSDASIKMFPVRVFLYEKLSNFELPLWTERVFLGYPLYLDIENGILNPINLLSIFLFGPVWSLKFLHLGTYLFGSLCIFNFIKDNFKNYHLAGGLLSVLAFYFSFFQINHLIHMNMVLVAMLLPIHIYLLNKYYESKRVEYL